jgi:hypothetical protein
MSAPSSSPVATLDAPPGERGAVPHDAELREQRGMTVSR